MYQAIALGQHRSSAPLRPQQVQEPTLSAAGAAHSVPCDPKLSATWSQDIGLQALLILPPCPPKVEGGVRQ